MRKFINCFFLLLVVVSLLNCDGSTTRYNFNNPADYGFDSTRLFAAYSDAENIDGIYSLLVSRYGEIVAERYFHLQNPGDLHDVRSVTKSLTSILIGIAIDKGYISGINEKISKYISPLVTNFDADKKSITIKHLLTMSAGFQWPPIGDWSEFVVWINAPDQINHVMSKPVITTPGAEFNYNDGASHLLSVILTEATGLSEKEFANKYLFNHLDIGDRPWRTDNRGYNLGNVAIKLTPRDMIKLGNLFLNKGVWNEERIVSEEWVDKSTSKHMSTGIYIKYEKEYGYQWWIYEGVEQTCYFANGYGGQFIVIVPELELVVVATNNWDISGRDANMNWYSTIQLIIEQILPAVN